MDILSHVIALSPILLLAAKIGQAFALWALVCAAVRLVNAVTDYVNTRE